MKYLKYIGLIALLLASFVGIVFSVMFPPAVSAANVPDEGDIGGGLFEDSNGGYLGFTYSAFSIYKDEGCSVFLEPDSPDAAEKESQVFPLTDLSPEKKGDLKCSDDDVLNLHIVANENSFINHLNFMDGSVFKIAKARSFDEVIENENESIYPTRWTSDAFFASVEPITELYLSVRPLGVHNGSTDWLNIELRRNPAAPKPDVFYTVTASADGNGLVSPESKKVQIGDDCSFSFTAEDGYVAYRVEETPSGSGAGSSYFFDIVPAKTAGSFVMNTVTDDYDLTVFFRKADDPAPPDSPPVPDTQKRSVFITVSEGGSIAPATDSYTNIPSSVSLPIMAIPDDGYVLSRVEINGVDIAWNVSDGFFSIPASEVDQFCHVEFLPIGSENQTRTITITTSEGGTTDPSPGIHSVDKGIPFPIFFVSDDGFVPYSITIDDQTDYSLNEGMNGFTIPASWSDQTVHVEYQRKGSSPSSDDKNPDKDREQNPADGYIASVSDSASAVVPSALNYLVKSGQNSLEGTNGTYLVKVGKDDSSTSPRTGWF